MRIIGRFLFTTKRHMARTLCVIHKTYYTFLSKSRQWGSSVWLTNIMRQHDMGTFSSLLALCEGNPFVDSPHNGPAMRRCHVLCQNRQAAICHFNFRSTINTQEATKCHEGQLYTRKRIVINYLIKAQIKQLSNGTPQSKFLSKGYSTVIHGDVCSIWSIDEESVFVSGNGLTLNMRHAVNLTNITNAIWRH